MMQLLITCDDCGLSQGINEVTRDHFQQGMVSSASIMTTWAEGRKHAFELLSQEPNLELGLHLNLTEGKPLTEALQKSEVTRRSGVFRNRLLLMPLAIFPPVELTNLVRAELRAQIEVFLETGLPLAHLTTHMHFHIFPSLRKIVYELGQEYGVKWVRNPDIRQSIVPYNLMRNFELETAELPHDFIVPDYLISLYHWVDASPTQLLAALLKCKGIVELVLHPSPASDTTFPKKARYQPSIRVRESRYLVEFFTLLAPYLENEIQIGNSLNWGKND